jgi:hypothetical protein
MFSNKQQKQSSSSGRFDLKKLNDIEVKYQVKISNNFSVLENIK